MAALADPDEASVRGLACGGVRSGRKDRVFGNGNGVARQCGFEAREVEGLLGVGVKRFAGARHVFGILVEFGLVAGFEARDVLGVDAIEVFGLLGGEGEVSGEAAVLDGVAAGACFAFWGDRAVGQGSRCGGTRPGGGWLVCRYAWSSVVSCFAPTFRLAWRLVLRGTSRCWKLLRILEK